MLLWYRRADTDVANRFGDALDRAIERIAETPERFPIYLANTRRLLLRRFPYAVIYRLDPGRIIVLAIAHQRRRPGYWQRRTR